MELFEKLGIFYIGKDVDAAYKLTNNYTLLKSKSFTTHAAIIGMTGSGKTGLGITILEEAAIDNIPSIVIDPKGDMTNLALRFEHLSYEEFLPWVKEQALRDNKNPVELAKDISKTWTDGLNKWDESPERIKQLKNVDVTIYTPGADHGIPVSILTNLKSPPQHIINNAQDFALYLSSTVNALLSLISLDVSPTSKEFTLLSAILSHLWMQPKNVTIEELVGYIVNPPFKKIGVLTLSSFFKRKDRLKLAMLFNNMLVSPSFSAWMEGVELDFDKLLYKNGKARTAVFTIAHLSDNERMFFVTILLNRFISWMRRQPGSSGLRMLMYMDEIFNFFPPVKNPPSKEPMLLLLKQARAYGIGLILATQNPVDLDYKGLSNIGTWFIGRLQTKQDVSHVIDGLEEKFEHGLDKKDIRKLLASLKKRVFLLKSVHIERLNLFHTRWALSYLKGPLTNKEISLLMKDKKELITSLQPTKESLEKESLDNLENSKQTFKEIDPVPPTIPQYYSPPIGEILYKPFLYAHATVRFFNQTRGIDIARERSFELPITENTSIPDWDKSIESEDKLNTYMKNAPTNARFATLPEFIKDKKAKKAITRTFKEFLYANERIKLYKCQKLKLTSEPEESIENFTIRVQEILREKKSAEREKLIESFEKKEKILETRYFKAKEKLVKEKEDVKNKAGDSFIHAGVAALSLLFGRKPIARTGMILSSSKRILKEKSDVKRAKEYVELLEKDIEELKKTLEEKVNALNKKYTLENYPIKEIPIKPKKTDISVKEIAILWKG